MSHTDCGLALPNSALAEAKQALDLSETRSSHRRALWAAILKCYSTSLQEVFARLCPPPEFHKDHRGIEECLFQ